MIINSNISSLNAQKNTKSASENITKTMIRLSTGLRINSAVDDSAGLAISERKLATGRARIKFYK